MGSYSQVNVNGVSFEVKNGRVYKNGKLMVEADSLPGTTATSKEDLTPRQLVMDADGTLTGDVHGDLHITSSMGFCLIIQGNCGDINLGSAPNGDVHVGGNVEGNIKAGGSVEIKKGKVGGNIAAGGAVTVGDKVGGNVAAGGKVTVGGKVGGNVAGMR